MILKAKQLERLSINRIEKLLGVDGTIYKAHKADKYPVDPDLVSELVRKLGIRQEWWDREWKTNSDNIFITSVQNRTDNKEKNLADTLDEAMNKVIKDEGEYYIVPKTVLEGNYRFIPIEELRMKERELEHKNDELVRKDHQIQGLHELFKMVLAGRDIPKIEAGKDNASV